MTEDEHSRLSRMTTHWGQLERIRSDRESLVFDAQQALLERYGRPIRRYLTAAVRDPDAADEIAQEFALRMVKGYFRHADPQRGRFRDFVKQVLRNLIIDHNKGKQGRPEPLAFDVAASEAEPDTGVILDHWRDELLTRAWERLAAAERESGQPVFAVLRFRAEHPDLSSGQIAEQLTAKLQPAEPFTDVAIRKKLERARKLYADVLLEEAERLLQTNSQERLEEGLIDMGLFEYCRSALERRQETS